MKKKVKGFTLVELIVVTAIFGIIMAAALGLLSPVQRQFTRTAKYEGARSAVDNVNRYISGSLRYADRLMICAGSTYNTTDADGNLVIDQSAINSKVAKFGEYYFKDNYSIDEQELYVLSFDNSTGDVKKYTYKNSAGSYVFNMQGTPDLNPINSAITDDYQFKYYIGAYDYVNEGGVYTLKKQANSVGMLGSNSVSFTVDVFKKYASKPLEPLQECSISTFTLVNSSLYPLRPMLDDDGNIKMDDTGKTMYKYDNTVVSPYYIINENNGTPVDKEDNFFIIYTLPKKY